MRLIDADAIPYTMLYKENRLKGTGVEKLGVWKDTIDAMPTIEPQRKTAKWIPHSEKRREYIGTVLVNVEYDYWFCDNCGYRVEKGQPMYKYCPNCGAKMEGI